MADQTTNPIRVSNLGTPPQDRLVPNTLSAAPTDPVHARYIRQTCGPVSDILPVTPSPCVRQADCVPGEDPEPLA